MPNALLRTPVTLWTGALVPADFEGIEARLAWSAGLCFQATFAGVHDSGASVITGPFPYWWSTQRLLFVILAGVAAADPATQRLVHAWMAKAARGVDQWAIIQATTQTPTGGTVGPLSVGSPMGCVPFGALSFVNTP